MQHLLIATHNRHKTREFSEMLGGRFEIADLTSIPGIEPAEETGTTFEENAILKGRHAAGVTGGLVLADDSGLEVDALNGAPGVYSARFAGEDATDAANRAKLLRELKGVRGKQRSARFRCVLALVREGDVVATFSGAIEGVIVNEEKGDGGFGYDPIFVPEGSCRTMAQLDAAEKHAQSHRGRALRELLEWLEGNASSLP